MPQVMAAVPREKRPTRKTTRKGAGKRKVHFGEASNDGWQQFPKAGPNPLHSAVDTNKQLPIPMPPTPIRRPVLKSTVRREDKTAEAMEEEKEEALDLSRMPRSFPIGQPGEPTPRITNLTEPPPGAAVPPMDKSVVSPSSDDYPPGFSPLHRIAALETLLITATGQLAALRTTAFANTRAAEEAGAAPPKEDVADLQTTAFVQYNLAQADCGRVWSLATLNNESGQFQIEGHTPRVAILDTGAGSITLGKTFAATLPLYHLALLIPAGSFMTASVRTTPYRH